MTTSIAMMRCATCAAFGTLRAASCGADIVWCSACMCEERNSDLRARADAFPSEQSVPPQSVLADMPVSIAVDPLDVEYDELKLRTLLEMYVRYRTESVIGGLTRAQYFTPLQAAAVTAYRRMNMLSTDPMNKVIDGIRLGTLLAIDDRLNQFGETGVRDGLRTRADLTPAQRAAISAHWSAELRRKVAASKEREQNRVKVDLDE